METPFRSTPWIPFERRTLLNAVKAHLESLDTLGFEVGEGEEVVDFLAGMRDMDAVRGLLEHSGVSGSDRKIVLGWVEERRDELARPKRRWWWPWYRRRS